MRKKRITVIIGRMFCGGAFNLWNRQNKTKTAMKLSAVVMLLCLMLGACAQKQKIPAATYMGGNHTITEICKELDTAGASHVDTFREWVTDFADSAGKNAIVMDRNVSCDPSLYTAWVGSDFTEEGRNAARWLEEDLKGKKFDQKETVHIVVLRGTSNASATLGRTKGFAEIAKTHPNWEILDSDDADFTTAKGREVMEKYLQKYKDIDVVVSQNDDMTFGAIEAIRAAGKTTGTGGDITLISFDGTRSALEKVKSGVINVDIECNPLQGTYIQEIINRLEDGESVDKINYVEEKVYTQKNVLSVLGDRVY